jgi:hypothetical protein
MLAQSQIEQVLQQVEEEFMKKLFSLLLICLLSSVFALADTSHASLALVRNHRHHARQHHAHRAAKHRASHRQRHSV